MSVRIRRVVCPVTLVAAAQPAGTALPLAIAPSPAGEAPAPRAAAPISVATSVDTPGAPASAPVGFAPRKTAPVGRLGIRPIRPLLGAALWPPTLGLPSVPLGGGWGGRGLERAAGSGGAPGGDFGDRMKPLPPAGSGRARLLAPPGAPANGPRPTLTGHAATRPPARRSPETLPTTAAEPVAEGIVQAKPSSRLAGLPPFAALQPAAVRAMARAGSSGGQLSEEHLAPLEPVVGAGFRHVRIHTSESAAKAAAALGAEAFTIGRDIFFAKGKFEPHSPRGRALLAHELTHVGQQMGLGAGRVLGYGGTEAGEAEAEAAERSVLLGESTAGLTVGRYVRNYTSADGRPLSPADKARLDAISIKALAACRRLLGPEPSLQSPETLAFVSVDLNLDISACTDDEAAEIWGRAIAEKISRVGVASGTPSTPGRAPALAIQRFEARQHESIERYALTGEGRLTAQEASQVYFGNWMRDMNQVFVPMVTERLRLSPDMIFAIIAFQAEKKFGQVMTPEQFGYYIPSEHMDNPAGLVEQYDLLPGQPALSDPSLAPPGPTPPPRATTRQESVDPVSGTVLGANIFSVDQAGVMAYIRRSNLHVERMLAYAAEQGRTAEGLIYFGQAQHAIEDLFAHSNWIEIAVSKTLRDNPRLLPGLTGAAREVHTFMPSVDVTGQHNTRAEDRRRPVLVTGSFLGADTMISLGSEMVTLLRTPLPPPPTGGEITADERFVSNVLRAISHRAQTDPRFRRALVRAIVQQLPQAVRVNPLLEPALDTTLETVPLDQVYDLSHLVHMPEFIRRHVNEVRQGIRTALHEQVMLPLADQLEAGALESQVSDTSLVQNLRENQHYLREGPTATQLEQMRLIERAGGQSVAEQRRQARREAQARVRALQQTPEAVLSGPSHSQLSKDHPDSPFFGLAFLLATAANRRLLGKMLDIWGAGPAQLPNNPRDPLARERSEAATESRRHGQAVVSRGRAIPAADYDLAAMRAESANQIREVATALRAVAASPGQANAQVRRLQALLGRVEQTRLTQLANRVARRTARLTESGQMLVDTAQLEQLASSLEEDARLVEVSRSLQQRNQANHRLTRDRNEAFEILAASPQVPAAFTATALTALNRQVAATAVSYTPEQVAISAGQRHVLADTSRHSLRVSDFELPSLMGRPEPLRALLMESRTILNHPYESTWWHQIVADFVREHARQIQAEIEARNAGYSVFRPSGEPADAHNH